MYACLHTKNPADADAVLAIARQFSPVVEETCPGTVVFAISPLRKLLGSPHQIAAEICRAGYESDVKASLAIAANIDTAILLAQFTIGVILVTPGEEQLKLAPIPLTACFSGVHSIAPYLLAEFHQWGLRTCEDLAGMPEGGVAERLGSAGVHFWNLARGAVDRPLRVTNSHVEYFGRIELDHPVTTSEPLLFLFARLLKTLCRRMQEQNTSARCPIAVFELGLKEFRCVLEFPVPLRDPQSMLKLLQLHLERHSPDEAVTAVSLQLEVVSAASTQTGLFLPPTPAPDKLQTTVARIANLVGSENVGMPFIPDTHRPDAVEMQSLSAQLWEPARSQPAKCDDHQLRLTVRLFRPALEARVEIMESAPQYVRASGVKGNVLKSAGPWKTSGEWWKATAWTREEWDVALDDGALYRIYQQTTKQKWFVAAVYD
jgi:protein ImuB